MLSNPTNPYSDIAVKYARLGATTLGLQLDIADISTERDIDKVLPTLSHTGADAVLERTRPGAGQRLVASIRRR